MSKPITDAQSIRDTMEDQFRKTMTVVHAIRGNTEELLHKTERVIQILGDEEEVKTEPQPVAEAEIEAEVEEILVETAVELALQEQVTEISDTIIDAVTVPNPELVAHITKACVKEVMATINPVLEALNKFIKANAIDKKPTPAPDIDDDAFAEKLIEEMKLSLGRRQRIALARKRMTTP
ncbi:MAG: hypothetical protein ORN49_03975 [Rhodobacteraceae bacterium]|nr:hypothetical protein [Paracoccaceae bacterium]